MLNGLKLSNALNVSSNSPLFSDEGTLLAVVDSCMTRLVHGEIKSNIQLKEELTQIGVHLSVSFPTVALFEWNESAVGLHHFRNGRERLRRILQQLAPQGSLPFLDDLGHVALIFSWEDESLLPGLHKHIASQFQGLVTIGVGLPCNSLYDVSRSFGQAVQTVRHKYYAGKGALLKYNQETNYREQAAYPGFIDEELYRQLKSALDFSCIEQVTGQFYQVMLQEGPVAPVAVAKHSFRLLSELEKKLAAGRERSPYSTDDLIALFRADTFAETQGLVLGFLRQIHELLSPPDKEVYHGAVKKAIAYMEQQYESATLYTVASHVCMTPAYLSMLFKQYTGKTFIDQLTDIRIEKAKVLLRTTYLKNYEVAEKVGYMDARYFSQIFKKRVGLSPSEYRDMGTADV